jgi:hypothetical protein
MKQVSEDLGPPMVGLSMWVAMRRVARCEVLNEQFILLATQISKEGDWQSVDGKDARRKKGKRSNA